MLYVCIGYYIFYDNCRNSRALIGKLLLSICGQTREFIIHATRQQARVANSTICYRKKQIDVICVCPVINSEFRHNIVKVVIHSYFDSVMTKFMINDRTHA